jgi:hypothetical protein
VSAVPPIGEVRRNSLANTFRDAALMPRTFYSGVLQNMVIDKENGKISGGDPLLIGFILQFALSIVITLGAAFGITGKAGAASICASILAFLVSFSLTLKLNRSRFHDSTEAFRDLPLFKKAV